MSKSAFVFDVTEAEFDAQVLQKSKETPVVVDFWAPWCGPCRMLAPLLEKLVAARNGSVLLAKVNTDEEQNLAMSFQIESLPTVIAFRHGKPALEFMGLQPEAEISKFLDRLAPTEAEKEAGAAAKLEATDPGKAEQLYRQALKDDPRQEDAMLGLARLLIQRGENAEAQAVLENVAAGDEAEKLGAIAWLRLKAAACADEKALRSRVDIEPKNAQARYELGLRLAAGEKYEESLAFLIAAGERDRKLAGGPVREAMVKIFQVIGVRSKVADEFRAKLSELLY